MSEDSMRCRRAPELAFDTSGDELSRHKEALKVAIGALRELGLDYAHFTETVEKRVAAVLEPPEEFEIVPIARWMTKDGRIFVVEEAADLHQSTLTCGEVVKLTGTVKRPVRRAVIREYEVAGAVTNEGYVVGVGNHRPFADHPECHGKSGVLIFRTAE